MPSVDMALVQHQAVGFLPLHFSESPEIPDELNFDNLVDDLSSCSGSVNEILDDIDLESIRSGSVNEVLDLLDKDPKGDGDFGSLDLDDVDIPDNVSLHNTFHQIMNVKLKKESDNQKKKSDKIDDKIEPPRPTVRSVQGNQYRFGLIRNTLGMASNQPNKKEDISKPQTKPQQESLNDQLKQYFRNSESKSTNDRKSLNSFGTSTTLTPFMQTQTSEQEDLLTGKATVGIQIKV